MNTNVFDEIHQWVRKAFDEIRSFGTHYFPEATSSYPIVIDATCKQSFTGSVLITVIGGSFWLSLAGHNISEAAAASCAVLTVLERRNVQIMYGFFLDLIDGTKSFITGPLKTNKKTIEDMDGSDKNFSLTLMPSKPFGPTNENDERRNHRRKPRLHRACRPLTLRLLRPQIMSSIPNTFVHDGASGSFAVLSLSMFLWRTPAV